MRKSLILLCLMFVVIGSKAQLVEALSDDAWNDAEWISVVDAPVVTGRVNDHTRAADGANCNDDL